VDVEFGVSHEGENNLRVFENRNLLSVFGFKEGSTRKLKN
jgi:hypothetical protein